jgi:hypothetical protein
MSEAQASDKTQSFDTRVAHQVLLDGLDNIKASLEGATIERKVEVGSVLWELTDRLKEVLDGIKSDVRRVAVKDLGGQTGSTRLDGDDMGSANVTIPSASLRVPKGKDIESIKQVLGSRFPFFFEETVTYKPHKEFESRVEQVQDALEQKVLFDAVERQELTPRVSFRRDRPSRRDTVAGTDPETVLKK